MISQSQFITEFEKLEASFARSIPSRQKDTWYAQVEGTDYQRFKDTMFRLIRGDRFPNFGIFWDVYNGLANPEERKRELKGCRLCLKGMLHIVIYSERVKREVDCVAFCKDCHPELPHAVDPRRKWKFQPGCDPSLEGWRRGTNRDESLEMIREIGKALFEDVRPAHAKAGNDDEVRRRLANREGYGIETGEKEANDGK